MTVQAPGFEVVMPRLGLTMTEATITRWLQDDGAWVTKGMPLFELEYEKANLEIEAPASGRLRILVPINQVVPILSPIAVLEKDSQQAAPGANSLHPPLDAPGQSGTSSPEPHLVRQEIPTGNMPVDALSFARQTKIEPLKATPKARKLAHQNEVDLHTLTGSGPRSMITARDVLEAIPVQPAVHEQAGARITPLARRVAQDLGIDPNTISGSGPQGRIIRRDVERATEKQPAIVSQRTADSPGLAALSGLRGVIANRLSASWVERPQVTLTTEADATYLSAMRKQMQEEWQVKISYNAILIKIAARALSEHPAINSRLSVTGIQTLPEINIGLAVDTPRGLLVPVIKNADKASLRSVNSDISTLAQHALEGRSQPDELTGGTFTITNLGMYDIDAFTPIINPPECAILGIGRIISRPVGVDGQIVLRDMMALSLSFDHRLVDGAPAARFLQRIKTLIERCFLIGFEL